jgi:hypothetical protein
MWWLYERSIAEKVIIYIDDASQSKAEIDL